MMDALDILYIIYGIWNFLFFEAKHRRHRCCSASDGGCSAEVRTPVNADGITPAAKNEVPTQTCMALEPRSTLQFFGQS
jgi:hypothetical protein